MKNTLAASLLVWIMSKDFKPSFNKKKYSITSVAPIIAIMDSTPTKA